MVYTLPGHSYDVRFDKYGLPPEGVSVGPNKLRNPCVASERPVGKSLLNSCPFVLIRGRN